MGCSVWGGGPRETAPHRGVCACTARAPRSAGRAASACPARSDPPSVPRHREKLLKKPAPPPAPPQAPKATAPAPEPTKPGDLREARRRERQARSPPRR